jgi:FkbM family methyltransferase
MVELLVREIVRRNPFRPEHVPWIARVYARPFERWSSLGRQVLFGAPNFLLFYLYRRIGILRATGEIGYMREGQWRRIRFDARNTQFSGVYMKACAAGYEPHVAALVDAVCEDNGVLYDIGSNWGWMSLLVASRPGFKGRIHAFEPYPPSFNDLKAVVEQAGLGNQVGCHNIALSDQPGAVRMRLVDKFQSGQAAIEDVAAGSADAAAATLDGLQLPPPTLMKIDVEGAEYRVLSGGRETLVKHKPMIVFENGRCDGAVQRTLKPLALLQSLGYRLYHLSWLKGKGDNSYLLGDDCDPEPSATETLALQEFQAEERFLRPAGMNVFACHRDRLVELEKIFAHRTIGSVPVSE